MNVAIWIRVYKKIYTITKIRYNNNPRDKIEDYINIANTQKIL